MRQERRQAAMAAAGKFIAECAGAEALEELCVRMQTIAVAARMKRSHRHEAYARRLLEIAERRLAQLRAEDRAGALLKEMDKARGGNPNLPTPAAKEGVGPKPLAGSIIAWRISWARNKKFASDLTPPSHAGWTFRLTPLEL